jgi:NDP-sugar pyrophosphorylase family protein
MALPASPPPSPADVTVAILAGGFGTRLRSVVADRPKVLAEVAGRPFLAWWLEALDREGFREVVLCTGYRADQVEATFGARYRNLTLHYSVEEQPLGTGGALRNALPWLRSETVLVLNGDSYCHTDLPGFLRANASSGAQAGMVLTPVEDTRRFGCVVFDARGWLEEFREKAETRGPGWINAGLYALAWPMISRLPENLPLSLERDLMPQWQADGIHCFQSEGPFIDIGTPESFAQAQEFFHATTSVAA